MKLILHSSLFLLYTVGLSFCPSSPRMYANFEYPGSKEDIFPKILMFLEENGYEIKHRAPESGYILTDYKEIYLKSGVVKLSLSIHITDLVYIVGMGKLEIATSGIGNPNKIVKTKTVEQLPYLIQKKVFLPLKKDLEIVGLNWIKNRR